MSRIRSSLQCLWLALAACSACAQAAGLDAASRPQLCGTLLGRGVPARPAPGSPVRPGAFPLRSGEQVALVSPDGRKRFGVLQVRQVGQAYQIVWTPFASHAGFGVVLHGADAADLIALAPGAWVLSAMPQPVVGPLAVQACGTLR